MSVRLVILGLLQRRDLHGYELKQIIEGQMGDWTSIAFGSIYFALKKLAAEGLIEQVALERDGNRPSRAVYSLTEAGRAEFHQLLRSIWRKPERHHHQIDIALYFYYALPSDEIEGHIAQRIEVTRNVLEHVDRHREQILSDKRVPKMAKALFDHSSLHLEAELRWLSDLQAKLRSGEYP
jgi:DNA-binding PadR family transcriptional regulator